MRNRKIILVIFLFFVILSYILKFEPGISVSVNFFNFFQTMMSFLPAVFILIGIFEVWVKREVIEKHMGENSKYAGYIWAIILSGTVVGGLYVAFPIADSLYKKGARLSVVFTYIGAAAVCRVPMGMFEASFLGIKFTLIRLLVSMPLLILSGILMEKIIKKNKPTSGIMFER